MSATDTNPRAVSPVEAAGMISISRRQVDRLIARGELSAVKIGHRTTRVSVESIERLLREGRKRRSKGVSTRRTQRAAERSAEKRGEGKT